VFVQDVLRGIKIYAPGTALRAVGGRRRFLRRCCDWGLVCWDSIPRVPETFEIGEDWVVSGFRL